MDAWQLLTCWSGTCSAGATPSACDYSGDRQPLAGQQSEHCRPAGLCIPDRDGHGQRWRYHARKASVQFSAGTTSLGPLPLVGSAGISTATLVVSGNELPFGSATITATYNGSSTSAARDVSSYSECPDCRFDFHGTPAISGLTDGASFQQKYSPGMIMSVFGTTLEPLGTAESASSIPLPVTIDGSRRVP